MKETFHGDEPKNPADGVEIPQEEPTKKPENLNDRKAMPSPGTENAQSLQGRRGRTKPRMTPEKISELGLQQTREMLNRPFVPPEKSTVIPLKKPSPDIPPFLKQNPNPHYPPMPSAQKGINPVQAALRKFLKFLGIRA